MDDGYVRTSSLVVCAILTGGMGRRFDRYGLVDIRISRLSLSFKVDLSYSSNLKLWVVCLLFPPVQMFH